MNAERITLKAEIVRGETRHGGMDVFEVWHDSWTNRTKRHPIGRAYTDVRHAERCATRHGLTTIDLTKLGVFL